MRSPIIDDIVGLCIAVATSLYPSIHSSNIHHDPVLSFFSPRQHGSLSSKLAIVGGAGAAPRRDPVLESAKVHHQQHPRDYNNNTGRFRSGHDQNRNLSEYFTQAFGSH